MQLSETVEIVPPPTEQAKARVKFYQPYLTTNNFLLLGIISVGLVLRWSNLLVLPVFADEKLHIQGGLAAQNGKLNTDGLFNLVFTSRIIQSWFLGVIYFIFDNSNLLLLGRAFSGICGIVTILTSYKIGELLYSKRAGLIAAAFWAIAPYTLWHERINLADPLQATYTGLVIYFSLVLLRMDKGRKTNLYAVFLGLAMAAAFLAKFNAVLILPVPVLAVLFLYPPAKWTGFIRRLFLAYYLAGVLVLPVLLLTRNDLGSYQREKQIVTPTLTSITGNFSSIADWLYSYLTLPLFVLVVAGLGWAFFKGQSSGKFLLAAGLIPLVSQGGFLSVFYPRYFLFTLIPLFVLAGGLLDRVLDQLQTHKFGKTWALPAGLVILALPILWFDLQIVTNPVEAALPRTDRIQYIEGPWSGTGISDVVAFLQKEQAATGKEVIVFASQMIPSNGLEIELYRKPEFKLVQVDLIPDVDYVKLDQAFVGLPAYLVAMSPDESALVKEYQQIYSGKLNFVSVLTVPKPGNLVAWQVYRVDRK